jgi:hypothetical protein
MPLREREEFGPARKPMRMPLSTSMRGGAAAWADVAIPKQRKKIQAWSASDELLRPVAGAPSLS